MVKALKCNKDEYGNNRYTMILGFYGMRFLDCSLADGGSNDGDQRTTTTALLPTRACRSTTDHWGEGDVLCDL